MKVYTCSNINGLENVIHKSSQVVVEISSGCMILFTGDTYHAGGSTFERRNGSYPSNLRIFSYIVEDNFVSDNENIKSIKGNMLCTNCQTCLDMLKENMYYIGHIIKYGMNPSGINNLGEGTILMGNLEKVGWVVLKSGYSISPYGRLDNAMYHLNNDSVKFKNNWFGIDGKHRHMFCKQLENFHDTRFIDGNGDISKIHELLKSDTNIINIHLETNCNFDRNNKYKYYNLNLIRNNGIIKKDQQVHCNLKTSIIPYPYITKNLIDTSSSKIVVQTPVNSKKNETKNIIQNIS